MFQSKLWGIITILFLGIMLVACSGNDNESESEENTAEADIEETASITEEEEEAVPTDEELLTLVEESFQALQELDEEEYMNHVHSESPVGAETAQFIEQAKMISFEIELAHAEVIDKNEEEATIHYTQNTFYNDPELLNTQTTGVQTLRLDGDHWKMYLNEIEEIALLDGNGEVMEDQTGETVLDSIEGEYAEAVQKLNLNFDDTVQIYEYIEDTDYATATMFLPNTPYHTAQFSIEYIQDAKGSFDLQRWGDTLKESFGSTGGNVEVHELDSTDEEVLHKIIITEDDYYHDHVQLVRSFFKENDLYMIAFVVENVSDIDEKTEEEWVEKLKNIE